MFNTVANEILEAITYPKYTYHAVNLDFLVNTNSHDRDEAIKECSRIVKWQNSDNIIPDSDNPPTKMYLYTCRVDEEVMLYTDSSVKLRTSHGDIVACEDLPEVIEVDINTINYEE
jgi:hypothetical protein